MPLDPPIVSGQRRRSETPQRVASPPSLDIDLPDTNAQAKLPHFIKREDSSEDVLVAIQSRRRPSIGGIPNTRKSESNDHSDSSEDQMARAHTQIHQRPSLVLGPFKNDSAERDHMKQNENARLPKIEPDLKPLPKASTVRNRPTKDALMESRRDSDRVEHFNPHGSDDEVKEMGSSKGGKSGSIVSTLKEAATRENTTGPKGSSASGFSDDNQSIQSKQSLNVDSPDLSKPVIGRKLSTLKMRAPAISSTAEQTEFKQGIKLKSGVELSNSDEAPAPLRRRSSFRGPSSTNAQAKDEFLASEECEPLSRRASSSTNRFKSNTHIPNETVPESRNSLASSNGQDNSRRVSTVNVASQRNSHVSLQDPHIDSGSNSKHVLPQIGSEKRVESVEDYKKQLREAVNMAKPKRLVELEASRVESIKKEVSKTDSIKREPNSNKPRPSSAQPPQKHWKVVYRRFQIRLLFLSQFQISVDKIERYRGSIGSKRQTFDFLTRFHQQKPDTLLSGRVVDLLNAPDRNSSSEKLEKLLRLRLKNVSSYSVDQRLQFCRVMEYFKLATNRLVVKEGHKANAFYFILSGQVEIFKMVNGERCPLRLLVAGDSFGDRSMYAIDDLRTASVETVSDAELLSVDKREFIKITKTFDARIKADRLAKMAEIPEFKKATGEFLEKILPFCSFTTYEPQKPIMMEDAHIFEIFWILSGTCRCVKVVPFIKRLPVTYNAEIPFQMLPWSEGKHLQDDDELVRELLSIHNLPTGSHFPNLPTTENGPVELLQRDQFVSILKSRDSTDEGKAKNKCPMTIITNERVEVMYMSRLEFAQVVTPPMIIETIQSNAITETPMPELQELFISKIKWDTYKKKVTSQVHASKK